MPHSLAIRTYLAVVTGAVLLLSRPALAQQSFQVGDAVSASPTYMESGWQSCTVIQVMGGGTYGVACGPRRTEYAVSGQWIRPAAVETPSPPAASRRSAGTGAPGPATSRPPATSEKPRAPDQEGGARAARLSSGTYRCSGAMAQAGTMRLTVHSATEYSVNEGRRGTYSFDPRTQHILFQSGSLEGLRGHLLRPAQIGVTSRADEFYGTTCDLE